MRYSIVPYRNTFQKSNLLKVRKISLFRSEAAMQMKLCQKGKEIIADFWLISSRDMAKHIILAYEEIIGQTSKEGVETFNHTR